MDVAAWLRGLGLEQYEPAFRDNRIDAEILPKLTAEDLKDIGVAMVGDRRKLLEAIAALREGAPSSPAAGEVTEAPAAARSSAAERRQLTVIASGQSPEKEDERVDDRKPFAAIQGVRLPCGKGQPASRKRALPGPGNRALEA